MIAEHAETTGRVPANKLKRIIRHMSLACLASILRDCLDKSQLEPDVVALILAADLSIGLGILSESEVLLVAGTLRSAFAAYAAHFARAQLGDQSVAFQLAIINPRSGHSYATATGFRRLLDLRNGALVENIDEPAIASFSINCVALIETACRNLNNGDIGHGSEGRFAFRA